MNKLRLLINKHYRYIISKKCKRLELTDGVIDFSKAKVGKTIRTHLGSEYGVLEPSRLDVLLMCGKRGPQVVLPKDFGAIVANTGINKKSICIDAGSGSGWLASQLAGVCKKVITYEKREEFAKIARENFDLLRLGNVKSKIKDISAGFDETNKADLITLDLLNPEKVPFSKSLKVGGYCVAYVPHIEQAEQFVKSLGREMLFEKILDIKEDEYYPSGKLNTKNKIRHTGFLVFTRKIFLI